MVRVPLAAIISALFMAAGGSAATGPEAPVSGAAHAPTVSVTASGAYSVSAAGEPLVDLLAAVSRAGKVRLTAASELGERRVHVYVAGLSPAALRKALAAVVGGVWTSRRDSGWRLEPSPGTRRERDAEEAARRARFFAGLRILVQRLRLDQAGIERLRREDPWSAEILSTPALRAATGLTALLGQQEWRQLEETGRVSLPPERLGPGLLRAFAEQANRLFDQLQKEAAAGLPEGFQPPPPLDVDQASRGPLLFVVGPSFTGQPYDHLKVALGSDRGPIAVAIHGTGSARTGGPRWTGPAARSGPAPAVRAAAGPSTKLRFDPVPRDWGEVLRQVSRSLKLAVVSEEFTRQFPVEAALRQRGELAGTPSRILDQLCELFGYQWRIAGGVHEIRSAVWYVDRELEPPGTLLKAAAAARQARRSLSLDWLLAAAAVPPARQARLWAHAPAAGFTLSRHGSALRFLAAVTPAQWKALEGMDGLACASLGLAAREALLEALRGSLPQPPGGLTPAALDSAHLRLSLEATVARLALSGAELPLSVAIPLPSAEATLGASPPAG
jgi:hypothetical protein